MTVLDWDSEMVLCPSCGEAQGDLWEHEFGPREEIEVDCGECGKPYTLHQRITVRYAASPLPSEPKEGTQ